MKTNREPTTSLECESCGTPYLMVGSTPIRLAETPRVLLARKGTCPVCSVPGQSR